MNHNSYWNWTIDGAGGVLRMMDALIRDDAPTTVDQVERLMKLQTQLDAIVEKAVQRVENA